MNLTFLSKYVHIIKNKFKYLLKIYRDETKYEHQIITEKYSKTDKKTIFTIKSTGMSICPKFTAEELENDIEILKNFHPLDIKRIIKAYYSDNEMYQIDRHKIITKTIKADFTLFTLESDNNHVKKMLAIEIMNNKNILFSLSREDLSDICFEAGKQSYLNEMNTIKSNNTNHKIVYLQIDPSIDS